MRQIVGPHVRWMIRHDVPAVLAIESATCSQPWVEKDLLAAMRARNCIGMIAEYGDKLAGFMVYMLHRDHLEIIKFAVHPDHRTDFTGASMMAKLTSKLSSHRRIAISMEVREADLPMLRFLKSNCFLAVGVNRGAFDGEDGILMVHRFQDMVPVAPAKSSHGANRLKHINF